MIRWLHRAYFRLPLDLLGILYSFRSVFLLSLIDTELLMVFKEVCVLLYLMLIRLGDHFIPYL
jgi:hypothetical protein